MVSGTLAPLGAMSYPIRPLCMVKEKQAKTAEAEADPVSR